MLSVQEGIKLYQTLPPDELVKYLKTLPLDEMLRLGQELQQIKDTARQEEQLLFYQPVSEEARKFHLSITQKRVALGGNGSGKSESNLVDMIIALTGVIPCSLEDDYPREKLRPPISARLIVQSLTSTWEQTIKPKLQWDHWTGLADGKRGHWGWIPKRFLIKGKWEESWSERYRTLTLTNGSTLQVMSHGQEVGDFASASVHDIRVDEGPKSSVWRENMMRLREGGYIALAMTPPDDQSASWDAAWVYDELYEKGLPGPNKDPDIESFTFFTEDNKYLADDFISKIGKGLTREQKEVRFHGRFMHLGGRVYPTYSDRTQWWCFECNNIVMVDARKCVACGSLDVVDFCHLVEPFAEAYSWPCVYLLDPHPRKPYMMSWVTIDPFDDWWAVAELDIDADLVFVAKKVFDLESDLSLNIAQRIIDPNMGRSQAHNAGRRHITVAEECAAVGLRCNDSVSDDRTVGKMRVSERLKPDPKTRKPRFHLFNNCATGNRQLNKWSWDEWARYSSEERDPKQRMQEKNSDYPILFGYLGNFNPTFSSLKWGGQPIRRTGRVGAY